MRIGRVLPPVAAPLRWLDLWHGVAAMRAPARAIARFEDELRRHFGVNHVFLVSSGTAALTLTLEALRAQSDRIEVVIPAYTCPSIPAAVLAAGLQPRLCDIDRVTFDFDRADLEQTLSDATLCVIAHDLFGIGSNVAAIRAMCGQRGITVIEDAAQAMGIESEGRQLGTSGDVGIFSLGRGKTITCGSGGIIVTNSTPVAGAVAARYRRLTSPTLLQTLRDIVQLVILKTFIRPSLYWIPASLPWLRLGETIVPRQITLGRLSGMKAGLLRDWRAALIRSNRVRSDAAAYFSRLLQLTPPAGTAHPYLRLPVSVTTPREKVRLHAHALARGLGLSIGYPAPVNEMPELRGVLDGRPFPSARHVADTLLTLPTHEWLSLRDRQAIVDCMTSACSSRVTPWAKSHSGLLSRSRSTRTSAIRVR